MFKLTGAICFTVLSLVASQLLLKKGMIEFNLASVPSSNIFYAAKYVVFNKYVVLGILLSGLSSISWLYVLSKADLSLAYPFVSLAFPLVLVCSHFFFEDTISTMRWVGIGVIVIGLILTVQK